MTETARRSSVIGPAGALAMAAGAVMLFGVGDAIGFLGEVEERFFLLTSLLGWLLLVWAVIVTGGSAAVFIHRVVARRPVSWLQPVLLSTCVALVGRAVWMRPLWGWGSATGG